MIGADILGALEANTPREKSQCKRRCQKNSAIKIQIYRPTVSICTVLMHQTVRLHLFLHKKAKKNFFAVADPTSAVEGRPFLALLPRPGGKRK